MPSRACARPIVRCTREPLAAMTIGLSVARIIAVRGDDPFRLSAYRNAGLSVRRAKLISANALGGGRDDQFHPDRIRRLEIRSLGRLAQGVDAVLLLPGVRLGETRQLEHDP